MSVSADTYPRLIQVSCPGVLLRKLLGLVFSNQAEKMKVTDLRNGVWKGWKGFWFSPGATDKISTCS